MILLRDVKAASLVLKYAVCSENLDFHSIDCISSLFTQGKYDQAIECYTTGISLDGESAVLLANRAMALLKQEKFGAAEVDCTSALEIDPSYVKVDSDTAIGNAKRNWTWNTF